MEEDKNWTADELLDQFSYESGIERAKLHKGMNEVISDDKARGNNWNIYEALILAGLFWENESHVNPNFRLQ